ncbi:hypothetical protein MUP01_08895 [Candidatus Bathyarchaeota archaeon]|nr:hypothetical protein [Candidatus Bathyarchaeota archaeon]
MGKCPQDGLKAVVPESTQNSPKRGRIFAKRTSFEGYYTSYWEASFLQRDPDFAGEGRTYDRRREELRETLEYNLRKHGAKEPAAVLFFDHVIPREVFEKLLENPNTKFQFKFHVEARISEP